MVILSYLGPNIWNIIPNEIKSAATLIVFNCFQTKNKKVATKQMSLYSL